MLFISQLQASAIRNLGEFEIEPAKGLNFFYGPNASGKTSVLETVYLLSRVKSFRTKRIHNVISRGEKKLQVFAKGTNHNNSFTVGVEKGHGITRLKFDGEIVQTASEQAKRLPVYILTPEHHLLFTGTPKERRHWLDWSLFHVEHTYLQIWKSYHRALRHRNALLKLEKEVYSKEIDGWEKLMAEEAEKIDSARQAYISNLNSLMNSRHLPIVLSGDAKLSYQNNSYADAGLVALLANNRKEDARRGFTALGPHRTDIVFMYDDFNVAKHLSRGQIKLYGAALISSQIDNLKANGIDAMVLIDDLDAELDNDSSRKMLDLLLLNKTQTFVSSLIRQEWIPKDKNNHAVFHVKHGKVQKMLE